MTQDRDLYVDHDIGIDLNAVAYAFGSTHSASASTANARRQVVDGQFDRRVEAGRKAVWG